ncbi:MFS transporter [Bacillus cereus group sp. BfR-BA-01380]|uniref:MFS transporter n=1 Tax=Bacillus cereus group sp. BfR-BA-01380 TaxID=2920324 RepID=UPI001F59AC19|nr:MFS transporter [Bacillus cereus group sp. BfR-BA-01380]
MTTTTNRTPIFYIICISALLGSLAQNMYTPILPIIQGSFHTSFYVVNLTVSIFTFVLAIMQIVYGPLIDTKGRKSILIPGLLMSFIGSIGCVFSPNIYIFLIFRAIQAFGTAAIPVVSATIIGDLYEGNERGKAMSIYQTLLALAPAIGPLMGGYLGNKNGHVSIFLFLAAISIILLLINVVLLPETKPVSSIKQQVTKHYFRVLQNKIGFTIVIIGFIQFYLYFCFLVFLPPMLKALFHLHADTIGLIFVPMSLCMMLGSYCYKMLQKKIQTKHALLFTSFFHIACILLFSITYNITIPILIIVTSLYGFSTGLSIPTHTTLLTEEFVDERATAIGIYNFIRYFGMGVGPLLGSFLLFDQNYFWIFFSGFVVFLLFLLYAMKNFIHSQTRKEAI